MKKRDHIIYLSILILSLIAIVFSIVSLCI